MKKTFFLKKNSVAKAYARALHLIVTKKTVDEVQFQLSAFCGLLYEPSIDNSLLKVFKARTFSKDERQKLIGMIADAFGLNSILKKLVELLVKKERLLLLDQIFDAYNAILDDAKNIARGAVTTADVLSTGAKSDLEMTFSKKLNKQVLLKHSINKDILGGLVVDINGLTFDGSLRTSINQIRETLERR